MSNKIITLDGLNTFLSNVKTYLTELLLSKQDKLVSGENIVTVNGNSILSSGNVLAGDITTEDTDLEIIDPLYIEPAIDYSKEYLTIQSLEDNNEVSFSTNNIMYQPEGSSTWSTLNTGEKLVLNTNQKVKFKMDNPTITTYGMGTFSTTGNYKVYGNIMSLLYGDDFADKTDLTGKNSAFYRLFYNSTKLIDAARLILPATTLANYCYSNMFYGCTGLTTVPENLLPATTLAKYCYYYMFYGCTSLTEAPALPATTLANSCYDGMFYGCTSLVKTPVLPATTLANYCYRTMFYGCTGLTQAPELPATTLANECYSNMFSDCTSLTTAPELPATTLANECYSNMFSDCTSLTTAPELPATTLADYCYIYMFQGCSNLNYIKALFTTNPAGDSYTNNWVYGVSDTGTFVKSKDATWNVIGIDGIPEGWTVETV